MTLTPETDTAEPALRDRSRKGRDSTGLALAILAIPLIVVCVTWWPGHVSADFLRQWREATVGPLTDWGAPLVSVLIRIGEPFGMGPGWLLVGQTLLLTLAVYGVFRAGLSKRAAAIATSVLLLLPHTFGFISWLGRDVWYVTFTGLAVGAIVAAERSPSIGTRRRWLVAAVGCLILVLAARQNAVFTIPPLAIALVAAWQGHPQLRGIRQTARFLVAPALLTIGVIAANSMINVAVGPRDTNPESMIFLHDLAGMSQRSGSDLMPDALVVTSHEDIRQRFSVVNVTTIDPAVRRPTTRAEHEDLRAAWIRAVTRHPMRWLQVRWDSWAMQIALTSQPVWVYHPFVDPNAYGWEPSHPSLDDAGREYVDTLATAPGNRGTPLQMPWLYLVLAAGCAWVLLRSPRPERRVVGWLCVAGWTYQIGVFGALMGVDYRIQFPLVLLTSVAVVVTIRELRERPRPTAPDHGPYAEGSVVRPAAES